jgi:hypothetical protein
MNYLFKSMVPDNIQYPKMTDNDGKVDCLICFCSAFPSPHNVYQLDTCIAHTRQRHQRLHIDLSIEPWRSKPEAYWQPVVDWLVKLPSVGKLANPTAAIKLITPSANWT